MKVGNRVRYYRFNDDFDCKNTPDDEGDEK